MFGVFALLFMNVINYATTATDCKKMWICCAKVEIPPNFSDYPFEI